METQSKLPGIFWLKRKFGCTSKLYLIKSKWFCGGIFSADWNVINHSPSGSGVYSEKSTNINLFVNYAGNISINLIKEAHGYLKGLFLKMVLNIS